MNTVQGDTWSRQVRYLNPDPQGRPDPTRPVDLTGWHAKLQVRRGPGTTAVLTLTDGAGITVDGPTGTLTWRATPAQMAGIDPGVWRYQLEVWLGDETDPDDRVTLLSDRVTIDAQVSA